MFNVIYLKEIRRKYEMMRSRKWHPKKVFMKRREIGHFCFESCARQQAQQSKKKKKEYSIEIHIM